MAGGFKQGAIMQSDLLIVLGGFVSIDLNLSSEFLWDRADRTTCGGSEIESGLGATGVLHFYSYEQIGCGDDRGETRASLPCSFSFFPLFFLLSKKKDFGSLLNSARTQANWNQTQTAAKANQINPSGRACVSRFVQHKVG